MSIYDSLNDRQQEAVFHTDGPVLILAGAGSGKTRVLTHRVAYLIENKNVNPWNILAITFTNKAAGEMRERVDDIVGFGSESIWVSTFHSTCVRILRRYIERLGFGNNFTIYDTDDSKNIMKDVCKRLEIDTKQYKERALLSAISSAKNDLISPEEYELKAMGDYGKQKVASVYKEYQGVLRKNNALDFDDLIGKQWNCSGFARMCWIITRSVSVTSWWTSIRIRTQHSLNWCACWRANTEISAWWGMMISPFINSGRKYQQYPGF